MMLNNHYRDMLRALSDRSVKYMLVGGYALGAHGQPRATLDFDLFVEASQENADAIFKALADFGAPLKSDGVTPSDFATEGTIYQIGVPPCRIDIITKIDGVSFSDAYQRSVESSINGVPVRVISLEDLLANKKAAGRPKDLGDIVTIEHMMKKH